MEIFDLIVIGGGPAGLAAAIYGGRAQVSVAVIEKAVPGGQIVITNEIENYPGVVDGESGPSLMQRVEAQAKNFGATFIYDDVVGVDFSGDIKRVRCAKGGEYEARAAIITTGAKPRLLGVPGEDTYIGRGVSYCATCDGAFFKGKDVFVVGGGDSAVEEAAYLTKFARKVTIIHRRDELRAAKNIQHKAFRNEKVEILWDTIVTEVSGDAVLRELKVKNVKTGAENVLKSETEGDNIGFFVFIGREPSSKLFEGTLAMDELGFLLTDEEMKTNVDGVYAAGDIRKKLLRQVLTASADGAIASVAAAKYVEEKFKND